MTLIFFILFKALFLILIRKKLFNCLKIRYEIKEKIIKNTKYRYRFSLLGDGREKISKNLKILLILFVILPFAIDDIACNGITNKAKVLISKPP